MAKHHIAFIHSAVLYPLLDDDVKEIVVRRWEWIPLKVCSSF